MTPEERKLLIEIGKAVALIVAGNSVRYADVRWGDDINDAIDALEAATHVPYTEKRRK